MEPPHRSARQSTGVLVSGTKGGARTLKNPDSPVEYRGAKDWRKGTEKERGRQENPWCSLLTVVMGFVLCLCTVMYFICK